MINNSIIIAKMFEIRPCLEIKMLPLGMELGTTILALLNLLKWLLGIVINMCMQV